ncbi:hypothetical protein EVAR_35269_1 [Eumeta japonica]|uniref:Uncharacterized protein n=1 Tax=Eumeta variegata TaxID=151549 RepID=A0A4C1VDH5_EUMVA|nr:hypothetical protein EVAR_35269_1 [Eumeta japonica]
MGSNRCSRDEERRCVPVQPLLAITKGGRNSTAARAARAARAACFITIRLDRDRYLSTDMNRLNNIDSLNKQSELNLDIEAGGLTLCLSSRQRSGDSSRRSNRNRCAMATRDSLRPRTSAGRGPPPPPPRADTPPQQVAGRPRPPRTAHPASLTPLF